MYTIFRATKICRKHLQTAHLIYFKDIFRHSLELLPPILIRPPTFISPYCCLSVFLPIFLFNMGTLIGGGSGFSVLHKTLKNKVRTHFYFFFS